MNIDLPAGLADWARGQIAEVVRLSRRIDDAAKVEGKQVEEDGEQFETMLLLLDELFRRFELPALPEFSGFFEGRPGASEARVVDDALANLVAARRWWQSRPETSREQTLADAVERRLEAATALPMIGVPMHVYTEFVYSEVLLAGEASVGDVLAELDRCMGRGAEPLLDDIGRAAFGQHPDVEIWHRLERAGLRYIDRFLQSSSLSH